ncbi:Uncharacterised protein [Raoultella planticola]|uniref:Uncharacterized protein n=1 Tax=Raoultella planticola TaxID=575 RepID=A0A485AR17_RAOPL|nr:Uncharacterised protein [Raoultella planticola]
MLIAVWEGAARWQNNDLMFPGFWQTFTALQEDIASGELPRRAWLSIGLLLKGYLLGTFLAAAHQRAGYLDAHWPGFTEHPDGDV